MTCSKHGVVTVKDGKGQLALEVEFVKVRGNMEKGKKLFRHRQDL